MLIAVILLWLLGAASIGYFIFYITMLDITNFFTYFWLLFGVLLVLAGGVLLWVRKHPNLLPVWLCRTVLALAGIGVLVFVIVEGILLGFGHTQPSGGADYVIVLGARVKGQRVTYNLQSRLDAAYQYLEENPSTVAILSGGRGPGEDISEAEAMSRYLQQKGVAPERLILEDQSVNTNENLAFSIEKMGRKDASVVIATNSFHIFRAMGIAGKMGLEHVQGLGSRVKWYTAPNMYVREAVAVLKYALCGQLAY